MSQNKIIIYWIFISIALTVHLLGSFTFIFLPFLSFCWFVFFPVVKYLFQISCASNMSFTSAYFLLALTCALPSELAALVVMHSELIWSKNNDNNIRCCCFVLNLKRKKERERGGRGVLCNYVCTFPIPPTISFLTISENSTSSILERLLIYYDTTIIDTNESTRQKQRWVSIRRDRWRVTW